MSAPSISPFETWNSPIEPGVTLIEASAGTGKTHAIVSLFLRLLIEERLKIEQILVVTYTEAATAELRGRVRQALRVALDSFDSPEKADPRSPGCLPVQVRRRPGAKEAIQNALSGFDLAQIRTIHGFCATVLSENAFESGALFDAEILPNQTKLIQEIAEDFWRIHLYPASSVLCRAFTHSGVQLNGLINLAEKISNHPGAPLKQPYSDLLSYEEEVAALESAVASALQLYRNEKVVVEAQLERYAGNRVKKAWSAEVVHLHRKLLEEALAEDREALQSLIFFGANNLSNGIYVGSKNRYEPDHPFFQCCEKIEPATHRIASALYVKALSYFRTELDSRKEAAGVRSYHDLLAELAARLRSTDSERLVTALRSRYQGILIDEFQDTDPLQYEIFSKLFARASGHCLYLIGDPKQSIFGFRGADVLSYLAASQRADRRFTLSQNFRADAAMIQAVNELYEGAQVPFMEEGIQFHPISPGGKVSARLLHQGQQVPSLLVTVISPEENLKSEEAVREATRWAGARTLELLDGTHTIGGEKVVPKDIAILARSNSEAFELQAELRSRGLPAVLQKSDGVFASPEATEVETLVVALAEPSRLEFVRAALLTPLFGWTLQQMADIDPKKERWERQMEGISQLSRILYHEGFAAMFERLFEQEKVLKRLLSVMGGERKVVNYLHLMEILQRESRKHPTGPEAILQILRNDRETQGPEEAETRLESDEHAVKIMTMHKCKGLEFPIVIAPFLWKSSAGRKHTKPQFAVCRDSSGGRVIVQPTAIDEVLNAQLQHEIQSEDARLLYVAVTRSVHHCSMLWHTPKNPSEALTRLLPLSRIESFLKGETRSASLSVQPKGSSLPGARFQEHTDTLAGQTLSERISPNLTLSRSWRMVSFSSLKSDLEGIAFPLEELGEVADDELVAPLPEVEETQDALIPPSGGTRLGTMMHLIYQKHQFHHPEKLRGLVETTLGEFGYAPEHADWVEERIRTSLEAELPGGIRLMNLAGSDVRKETEFHCTVDKLHAPKLVALLRRGERIAGDHYERFSRQRSILKGFIDLIFRHEGRYYLLDWKSNYLGEGSDAWRPEQLDRAMREHHYDLQYFLYTVALDRWLRLRIPDYSYETHFGGAFYLFLRGMHVDFPGRGVVAARPSMESLIAFEREFGREVHR